MDELIDNLRLIFIHFSFSCLQNRRGCVSRVGRALADSTSHVSLVRLVACLSSCVQMQFCLHPLAVPLEMKNPVVVLHCPLCYPHWERCTKGHYVKMRMWMGSASSIPWLSLLCRRRSPTCEEVLKLGNPLWINKASPAEARSSLSASWNPDFICPRSSDFTCCLGLRLLLILLDFEGSHLVPCLSSHSLYVFLFPSLYMSALWWFIHYVPL